MILEGLVTTIDAQGMMHFAPMGPRVEPDFRRFQLRPFPTSNTYENLQRHREGVLHVTDDVMLLARAAIGQVTASPPSQPAERIRGHVLTGACRAYEFRVAHVDSSEPRMRLDCEVVHMHSFRDFFGFNRAKHAVVEAAILATRVSILPAALIEADFARLALIVEKTGGLQERDAFAFLDQFVRISVKEKS
jgi:hypothetical protein